MDVQSYQTVALIGRFLCQNEREISSVVERLVDVVSLIMCVLAHGIIKVLRIISGVDGNSKCVFLALTASLVIIAAHEECRVSCDGGTVVGVLRQQVVVLIVPAVKVAVAGSDVAGEVGGE